MLDARRAKQKGYITLKEAAAVSGYSPDYVGQLIRGGKIKGEQVYCTVAWVTTETEVLRYSNEQKGTSVTPQPVAAASEKWRGKLFIALAVLVLLPLVGAAVQAASQDVTEVTTQVPDEHEYK